MNIVYLSIGSNLISPQEQTNTAIRALKSLPNSQVTSVSFYYETIPLGPQNQPNYLNAAVAMQTTLTPEILLDNIQRIEIGQGRVHQTERWGPRTLDLDIMLFGNKKIQTNRLTIPHYDMKNRGFMLWPLFEIAPNLRFPDGELLKTVLFRLREEKPPYW